MHTVIWSKDIIVVASSANEATSVASMLSGDEDTTYNRLIYSLYPPFTAEQLEILLENLLDSYDPEDRSTDYDHIMAFLELYEVLSNVRDICSNVRESADLGFGSPEP